MDKRWQLTDAPRELTSGVTADVPLVTIAWRVLRAEHKRRKEEARAQEDEARRTEEALAKIAEQAHRLHQVAQALQAAPDAEAPAAQAQQLAAIAERLQEALRAADVSILAPEGEPYTAELMDLFENIAQQPEADLTEPRIAEVIKPAIKRGGALLRMGKAVIAIPERAPTVAPPSSSSLPPANPDLVPALDDAASAPAAERAEQIAEKQIASETV